MILLGQKLHSLFLISVVLVLLIVPVLVVSNVLAEIRPPPPPPPQHPGEVLVVVVQLVQVNVVVNVTRQITDFIPVALTVAPAAASPLAFTSADGLASMDVIGLATGSLAMIGAAIYVTQSKRLQSVLAAEDEDLRGDGIVDGHMYTPVSDEDSAVGESARGPIFEGVPPLTQEDPEPLPDGFHRIRISDSVRFQYQEQDGKTSLEGIVSSGRWFPGVLINKRFYSGIHNGDAFLPGIVSAERFIPGLVTEQGFFPGIATDDGFTPGIIAMGAFVPGIVRSRSFIPGVIRGRRFIPGCFTFGREFVPGRFIGRGFETGRMTGSTFTPSACEMLSSEETQGLAEKGVGVAQEGISDTLGGLPIRGVVVGAFDIPVALEVGLVSNEGVIVGGMMPGEHYRTMDPLFDRPLPTQDAGADFRRRLGISDEDRFGIHTGWNSKEKGFEDRMEKEWDNLVKTGFSDSSLFGPVNPGMPGQQSDLGRGIGAAFGFLGQGDHGLMDQINGDYNDMMKNVFGSGFSGNKDGTDGQTPDQKGTDGKDTGEKKDGQGDQKKEGSVWETIFGVIGAIIGAIGGFCGGGVAGGIGGGYGGYKTGTAIYQGGDWVVTQISGGGKKGGGGTKDDEGDDTRGTGYTLTERGYNPAIMHISDPGKRVLINWQQSDEWGPGKGDDHSQGAVINFIVTDTGRMVIINFQELSKLAAAGAAAHWGQVSMGTNVLTGETRWVSTHPLTPEEQRQHALHDMLVEMYMNPRTGGTGGWDSGGAGGKAPQAGQASAVSS